MNRFHLPLNDLAALEVTVRLDFVELRYADRCVAIIDRDQLRTWLTAADRRRFRIDDVTWSRVERGHMVFMIHHGGAWTLPPELLHDLAAQL